MITTPTTFQLKSPDSKKRHPNLHHRHFIRIHGHRNALMVGWENVWLEFSLLSVINIMLEIIIIITTGSGRGPNPHRLQILLMSLPSHSLDVTSACGARIFHRRGRKTSSKEYVLLICNDSLVRCVNMVINYTPSYIFIFALRVIIVPLSCHHGVVYHGL